jgi:hypothetical protein
MSAFQSGLTPSNSLKSLIPRLHTDSHHHTINTHNPLIRTVGSHLPYHCSDNLLLPPPPYKVGTSDKLNSQSSIPLPPPLPSVTSLLLLQTRYYSILRSKRTGFPPPKQSFIDYFSYIKQLVICIACDFDRSSTVYEFSTRTTTTASLLRLKPSSFVTSTLYQPHKHSKRLHPTRTLRTIQRIARINNPDQRALIPPVSHLARVWLPF